MRAHAALTLALLLAPAAARAQQVEARALFPYTHRADAVQPIVVTAQPLERARGDLTLKVTTSWPYGEARVRHAVSLGAGARRTFVLPCPTGAYDMGEATLEPAGASSGIVFGSGGSSVAPSPTWFGVVGLGGRVTAAVNAVNPPSGQARVLAATALTDAASGDPLLPALPSVYAGTHAIVAGTGAVLAAPPEARAALRDWVLAGGFLALSPRTVADLRDPWFADLLGPVTDDGEGRLSGPRLLARRWGAVAHQGLGVVGVIPHDLSQESWSQSAAADAALRDFVDFADGAGGGMVAPGELSLFRRFVTGGGELREAFRPRAEVRGLLVPVTVLLALYIVAVGVVLARNRRARSPLRVFVRLPLAALAVLVAVFASARLARPSASTARVLAVYDVGEASPRAVERVFAGLSAGSATTLTVRPPGDGVALYATGGSSSSSALRWDGRSLAVERVRLGLWETGLVYTERVAPAGGGIRVVREGPAVRLVNQSPWTLTSAVYVYRGTPAVRFPEAPPGATVTGERITSGSNAGAHFRSLFGRDGSTSELASVFLDGVVRSYTRARAADQVFALARLPEDVRGFVRGLGFTPAVEGALVRVVIPGRLDDPGRVGAYSGRLDARRSDYESDEGEPPEEAPTPEPEPVPVAPRDGGAAPADAVPANILELLSAGADASVQTVGDP